MKKNFTPLLYMVFPVLFFIYVMFADFTNQYGNDNDAFFWVGLVGAVLFTPLFLIGLIGTLVQLFKREKTEIVKTTEISEDNNNAKTDNKNEIR